MATYENSLVSGGEDLSIRVWNLESHTEENCIFVSINFLNKIHRVLCCICRMVMIT